MRAPTRRTQEQRREETRLKLLDATIRCLLDHGYDGTTTRRVCEVSGVSQGAQSYHFPRRVDLVGAAVEHMAYTRIAELRELAADLPTDARDRVAALLDVLWGDLSSPGFMVFVKLWVAAADDPELFARLVPVERMLTQELVRVVAELAGDDLLDEPGWEARLRLAVATCRGLALSERFEPRGKRRRDPWPEMRPVLLELLAPAGR